MDLKYRIRLQNERVIGPFSTEEIGELFLKGHITGTEMCQQFPIGDWKPLAVFPGLNDIVGRIESKNLRVPEATLSVPKKAQKFLPKKPIEKKKFEGGSLRTFTEFKFGKDVKVITSKKNP